MDQHTIPNCYLKAWCDPAPLPDKHTPFIWLISKDGKDKRKRAPHNAFTEAHRYSIRRENGQKILTVEQKTLELRKMRSCEYARELSLGQLRHLGRDLAFAPL